MTEASSRSGEEYLPHVKASIARLGYIKPAFAEELATLMQENEGTHPHVIARMFRQRGTQLTKENKRSLGIRANADMSAEAADALSQRGLSDPLTGIDATLLDASFSYFRERMALHPLAPRHCDLFVVSTFSDCTGCRRLDGHPATDEVRALIPPPDCERGPCSLGYRWKVDFLAEFAEKHLARKDR